MPTQRDLAGICRDATCTVRTCDEEIPTRTVPSLPTQCEKLSPSLGIGIFDLSFQGPGPHPPTMSPRIPLQPLNLSLRPSTRLRLTLPRLPTCLFCSLASRHHTSRIPSRSRTSLYPRRFQSTTATATTTPTTPSSETNPREELIDTLLELQKCAPSYVNLSRLQLALQGLRQPSGEESIRIAVLGLSNGTEPGTTAKEVLRLLLADPLASEQEWEKQLTAHDPRQPLVVRIRRDPQHGSEQAGGLTISKTNLLHEVDVSSPGLNGLNLELLLTEVSPFTNAAPGQSAIADMEEALLVPTVDIPSNTGRFTPVTTPVHKALLVTEGIMGAASVAPLPILENRGAVLAAVDLPGYATHRGSGDATFQPIDVDAARKSVQLVRENLGNAMDYEKLWYQSNLPALRSWLKTGVQVENATGETKATKPALLELVASLLENTSAVMQKEEDARLGGILASEVAAPGRATLSPALAAWSQSAHEELQQQLDLAFSGRRWRKLGWWKLFWRVDDVAMLTSEILSQRFLPGAERELVYLAGRIHGPSVAGPYSDMVYAQPIPESESAASPETQPKWPTHISFTRRYLHAETVPALQALAQKLILEASSTSFLTSSLGGLLYLSSSVSSLYEAGAVAALGIVWSLRRMQKKWEAARSFWEGEVREEGRKAVRGAEASVAEALDKATRAMGEADESQGERRAAKELVDRAADALSRMNVIRYFSAGQQVHQCQPLWPSWIVVK
ncbi:hypothetical protein ACRALDRAFT_205637 [Sodiomyces alcalophilus JCM 7366]|uniref:uncharacterized protein n=1 Tax=Sodiomyces alcalophilus JCM 7366 TaxID=591952 RepID=UPI0039B3DDCF